MTFGVIQLSNPCEKIPIIWAILYLGGNDIFDGCNPRKIISDVVTIAKHLKCLNQSVVITLLEPRTYPIDNRFGIHPTTYTRVSNSVNKRLCVLLKKEAIRTINFGARPFQRGHRQDGVHFNFVTKHFMTLKFRRCIEHHMSL